MAEEIIEKFNKSIFQISDIINFYSLDLSERTDKEINDSSSYLKSLLVDYISNELDMKRELFSFKDIIAYKFYVENEKMSYPDLIIKCNSIPITLDIISKHGLYCDIIEFEKDDILPDIKHLVTNVILFFENSDDLVQVEKYLSEINRDYLYYIGEFIMNFCPSNNFRQFVILVKKCGVNIDVWSTLNQTENIDDFHFIVERGFRFDNHLSCPNDILLKILNNYDVSNIEKLIIYFKETCKNFDINTSIWKGHTLLHGYAMRSNDINILKLFFKYGIDKNLKNEEGKTAYDIYTEMQNSNKEIIDLLK